MNGWFFSGLLVLGISVGLIGWCSSVAIDHWIQNDEALERFQELSETNDVIIVTKSNSNPFFGDAYDVTYELRVNGKPTSGRCTSGYFSPMVCRVYSGLDGE